MLIQASCHHRRQACLVCGWYQTGGKRGCSAGQSQGPRGRSALRTLMQQQWNLTLNPREHVHTHRGGEDLTEPGLCEQMLGFCEGATLRCEGQAVYPVWAISQCDLTPRSPSGNLREEERQGHDWGEREGSCGSLPNTWCAWRREFLARVSWRGREVEICAG